VGLARPTTGHFFDVAARIFTLLNDYSIITYTVTLLWPNVCPG